MMKKFLFASVFALVAAGAFVGCSDDSDGSDDNTPKGNVVTVDFESANLGTDGFIWGKTMASEQEGIDWQGNPIVSKVFDGVLYSEDDAHVKSYFNDYGGTYDTWYGFVVSNQTDRSTEGLTNDKSVYDEGGAGGSKNFAVASYDAYNSVNGAGTPTIEFSVAVQPASIAIANTTYFYLWFEGSSQAEVVDSFVFITGWNNGVKGKEVRVQLADGAAGTVKSGWETVDLSSLGSVTSLTFTITSDDPSGMVPNYFAIDNLVYLK